MAFDLQYLNRVYASVDLNKVSNPAEGQVDAQGTSMWTYNAKSTGANNTAAEVAASGYFNGATGYLSQGDAIYVACNDSTNTVAHLYNVTSATGAATVTVTQIA